LSDEAAFNYFEKIPKNNDLSVTAHWDMACCLAALHQTMLASLKRLQDEKNLNGPQLRVVWHERMEKNCQHDYRNDFFARVIERAKEASQHLSAYVPRTHGMVTVTKMSPCELPASEQKS
jgi:hypothetical protein